MHGPAVPVGSSFCQLHSSALYVLSLPQVRQLGHPALLAATYSGNSAAVATAAVNELEDALVGL